MHVTGSKAVLLSLIQEGIDLIFGYPGGAIMPVYDALHEHKNQLRHVLVRHEQGAIHAAEGYARVAGKPGVCLATSGPGATNLVTGIANAMLDSVPIVCITGQVTSSLLGTDAFQEVDILSITAPITKWSCQVTNAEEIPFNIAKAFHIAKSGRPGPVLIDITKDAQINQFEFLQPRFVLEKVEEKSASQSIKEAAKLINEASRPFLFVGHGVLISSAEKEILNLAEVANTPVASTLLGLSAFPTTHPLYVGMLGMHGNYGPNVLTNQADVIVAVGMRFDDRVTGCLNRYAKQAEIIHIEIDEAEIHKNVKATIPLLGDAKQILQEMLPHIELRTHSKWLDEFKRCRELEYNEIVIRELLKRKGSLSMGEVIHHLSLKNRGKAIIVSDVGQHQMTTARYHAFTQTNSHITSGGLGTMGFALPAAIGAKLAAMDRLVIAIVGDGGIQMNIQELAVIAQEELNVKIIILNNQYLGMVRQWQELFFEKRYSYTEMHNPNFVKIAEGYGIQARKIVDRSQLSEALDEMLEIDGAYLLEVVVEKEGNVFPMIPTGSAVDQVRLK